MKSNTRHANRSVTYMKRGEVTDAENGEKEGAHFSILLKNSLNNKNAESDDACLVAYICRQLIDHFR